MRWLLDLDSRYSALLCLLVSNALSLCLGLDVFFFFFQAEDGIRDAQESRGLGDVYKRQSYA